MNSLILVKLSLTGCIGWNQGFAEYAKIPEGFPVRSPYPMPGPAVPPPGDLPSAIYPPRMPTLRPQIPADLPPIPGPSSEVPASSIASSSRHPHTSDVPSVPQLVEPNHQKTPTPIRDSSPALEMHQEPAPAPETSAFQPYEPPAHYQKPLSRSPTPPADTPIPSSSDVTPGPSTKLQKWDPYEEGTTNKCPTKVTILICNCRGSCGSLATRLVYKQ